MFCVLRVSVLVCKGLGRIFKQQAVCRIPTSHASRLRVITDKKEEHLFAADSKMQRQDWVEALRLGALIARKADSQLLKVHSAFYTTSTDTVT